jgi:dTDP-4-amino-4,6-dideoxy-D-galactose acyltransferase
MIKELIWDSSLLRKKIGELKSVPENKMLLASAIEKARADGFQYLICKLHSPQFRDIRTLESTDFYLTDIGVTLKTTADKFSYDCRMGVAEASINIETASTWDIQKLKEISKSLFTSSRFYSDPFYSRNEADALYQAWIENSVKGIAADVVFFIPDAGFITCKKNSITQIGEITLLGIKKKFRAKGFGSALLGKAMQWFSAHDLSEVNVRTQLGNVDAVNFYIKSGFSLKGHDQVYGKVI